MFDFDGQVVLITGATGALGGVVAEQFAAAGARLVLVDRQAGTMAERFPALDAERHLLVGEIDLTNANDVSHMAARAVDHFEHVDVLINIAGGFRAAPSLAETDLDTWALMFRLNARATFLTMRELLPHMTERGQGKVVNTAARAALEGTAGLGAYAAAKSAVIRLTESAAAEVKGDGVNVNCVLPGTIDTPANRRSMPKADHESWVPREALADVYLFLASPAARAIHGAALPVYGLS